MCRIPPRFLPEVRNVHNSTLHREARANNGGEAWNDRFGKSSSVENADPAMWKLIEKMRVEVAADSP